MGTTYAKSEIAPTEVGDYTVTATFTMEEGYAQLESVTAILNIERTKHGRELGYIYSMAERGTAFSSYSSYRGSAPGDYSYYPCYTITASVPSMCRIVGRSRRPTLSWKREKS